MTVVFTNELKENMVLANDVKGINGRLLLQKGQRIQSNHIEIMKKWGVTEVNVFDSAAEEEKPAFHESPNGIEECEKKVMRIFQHTDLDHPAMKELFRLAVLYRSEKDFSDKSNKDYLAELNDQSSRPPEDIRKMIVHRELKLPEIPSIVFELNDILSDPLRTAKDLAKVVSKSPSLTTTLLKIANSSYYGFSSRIDTLSRAITLVGTIELSSLSLAICAVTVFENIPKNVFDMHAFSKHSFACGLISRILAENMNTPQTEQLFVAGLLHDIGRIIIFKHFPQQARALLSGCMASEKNLYTQETNYLGCRHTDIARYLLQEWNFPLVLEDNIFHHHKPMAAHNPIQASLIHLADIIVNAVGIGSSGENLVPPLQHEAWERLQLPQSSFEVIITQAIHQLSFLEPFLQP